FFQTVVRPYLANKKDKTFLDRWLLEEDLKEYLQPWLYGRLNTVERILLAQRLQDEPPRTTRYLNDLLRLQPPNTDRFLSLFDTAVKGRALDTEDALGFDKAKSAAPQFRTIILAPMNAAADPASGAGGTVPKRQDSFGMAVPPLAGFKASDAGASEKRRDGQSGGKVQDLKKLTESTQQLG